MDNIFINIFSIFFLILGTCFFSTGLIFIICGIISPKWPTVNALITESILKKGATGFGTKTYWPVIKYKYSIKNQNFTGNRVAFGKHGTKWNNTHSREKAQKTVNCYKKGHIVPVHYFTLFKKLSVLRTGFSWGAVGVFGFGALWLYMGITLFN